MNERREEQLHEKYLSVYILYKYSKKKYSTLDTQREKQAFKTALSVETHSSTT